MVFTFFIGLVFLSELVLTLFLIAYLFKLDKQIQAINCFLLESKSGIKEICQLVSKISDQIFDLTTDWIRKYELRRDRFILNQTKNILVSILLASLNIKFIKKIRKNKLLRRVWKGFNILQNMV